MPRLTDAPHPGPLRFALYRRVSTSMQADRDLSLPEQAAQQREYVAQRGGAVVNEYEDSGISGSSADARPAFLEMIAAAKRGEFDVILVHKSDRVFRNKDEASTYRILTQKIGIKWASVTESFFGGPEPADKLLTGIMESVNEFYIDNLRAEIKKGIRSAAMNKGRQHGPPPYGYRWKEIGKRGEGWIVDEVDAPRVVYMYEYMVSEAPSVSQLCHVLNGLGWPAPGSQERGLRARGLPDWKASASSGWQPGTVFKILASRTYMGEVLHHGEWLPGTHPAILPVALAESVHAIIEKRVKGRGEATDAIFGGGLLRCPHCAEEGFDSPLYIEKQRGNVDQFGHKSIHVSYFCARYSRQVYSREVGLSGGVYQRRQLVGCRQRGGTDYADPPDKEWECPGFRISERRVLHIILDYLDAVSGTQPEAPRRSSASQSSTSQNAMPRTRKVSIAPLLRQLADIPNQRMRYLHLYATSVLSDSELASILAKLEQQEENLKAQTDAAESAAFESVPLTPEIAAAIAGVLRTKSLTSQQRRDRLREYVSYLLPDAAKATIHVILYSNPIQT